jgi:anaerobic selenocysteine-containing dehydrogenase
MGGGTCGGTAGAEPADLRARYPLHFLTPNTKNGIHSQFNHLESIRQLDPGPRLMMHPADAAGRGIREGDRVRVFNDRGALRLPVVFDHGIRPGCVASPNGYWIQHGGTVNVLSAARETDMGHGAAFHECRVEVSR